MNTEQWGVQKISKIVINGSILIFFVCSRKITGSRKNFNQKKIKIEGVAFI